MDDLVRARVVISGRVQGVCFRSYAHSEAAQLDLTGWVKNRWDGKVEAVFEGDKANVEAMVRWCHRGSPYGHVTHVDVAWEKPTGKFDEFRITF